MREVYVDTNFFVRYFMGDIPGQFEKAKEFFLRVEKKEAKGVVSILVVNEIIWIMEHFYDLKREVYMPRLVRLLGLSGIKIMEIKKDILIKILEVMVGKKVDFTDAYLWVKAGKGKVVSFDRDFERLG